MFLTRDGDEEALEVDDVSGFDVFGEIAGVEVGGVIANEEDAV